MELKCYVDWIKLLFSTKHILEGYMTNCSHCETSNSYMQEVHSWLASFIRWSFLPLAMYKILYYTLSSEARFLRISKLTFFVRCKHLGVLHTWPLWCLITNTPHWRHVKLLNFLFRLIIGSFRAIDMDFYKKGAVHSKMQFPHFVILIWQCWPWWHLFSRKGLDCQHV